MRVQADRCNLVSFLKLPPTDWAVKNPLIKSVDDSKVGISVKFWSGAQTSHSFPQMCTKAVSGSLLSVWGGIRHILEAVSLSLQLLTNLHGITPPPFFTKGLELKVDQLIKARHRIERAKDDKSCLRPDRPVVDDRSSRSSPSFQGPSKQPCTLTFGTSLFLQYWRKSEMEWLIKFKILGLPLGSKP